MLVIRGETEIITMVIKKNRGETYKKIILLITTVVLMFLFLEICARISYPLYSNYNTEMSRYDNLIKKVSDNPELVYEHKPSTSVELYGVDIKTNSNGFRDYEHPIKKDNNTFRIFVLGDSITFGWGVTLNDTFTKLLERKLNLLKPLKNYSKYEVINSGIGNYNTAMELTLLKEKGLKYEPNLIILQFYVNDVEVTPKKSKLRVLEYSYFYIFLWDKYTNARVRFSGNDYKKYYSSLYEKDFIGKSNTEKAVNEIIRISKDKTIPILIVIFPEFHNFEDYPFKEANEFINQIANSNNVSVLDLLPAYQNYEPKTLWVSQEDVHPNSLGHEIAADQIYGKLIKQNYLLS